MLMGESMISMHVENFLIFFDSILISEQDSVEFWRQSW
jgi:hypothetical protein